MYQKQKFRGGSLLKTSPLAKFKNKSCSATVVSSSKSSMSPGAWDGTLQELLLSVEEDGLVAGDDVHC